MKSNIYKKLHAACINAGGVRKAEKKQGMNFNPLLHDAVQEVATQALLDQGLYPTCDYKTQMSDNFVLVVCTMKIHDVDNPEDFIVVDGCSAMGNLDKFGTGNAMSYSRKYAFLNLLNLKTGIADEDGYQAKPFKSNKESQAVTSAKLSENFVAKASGGTTQHQFDASSINVEDIKNEFANAIHLPRLKFLKDTVYKEQIKYLQNKDPNAFSVLKQEYESRMDQLNSHK